MKRRVRIARVTEAIAKIVGGATVAIVVSIALFTIGYLFFRGISAISWEFLTQPPRNAMRAGGIFPAIVGTFYLVLGTALFALPIGVGAGVYLAEYSARGRSSRAIRLARA